MYSECKANSNYPDTSLFQQWTAAVFAFGQGNCFHLSHGERRLQIPEFHCLEESPWHIHLGVNCLSPLLEKSTQIILAALGHSWPGQFTLPGNQKTELTSNWSCSTIIFKKPQPQQSSRGLSHSFNFSIHVNQTEEKQGRRFMQLSSRLTSSNLMLFNHSLNKRFSLYNPPFAQFAVPSFMKSTICLVSLIPTPERICRRKKWLISQEKLRSRIK